MTASELTIAICTHNRSTDLAECLTALYEAQPEDVEVLVVDSASSEEERRRIVEITADRPGVTLVRLDKPGLSLARNTALRMSRTGWLAFIDDDAIVASNWLCEAKRLIADAPQSCPVIGGRVDPIYPPGITIHHGPRWAGLLSLLRTEGEGEYATDTPVVGCNVIFRRSALLDIGGFPPHLGRVGKVLLSGEEKLAIEHLRGKGGHVYYSDRLQVGHKIPRERLERAWAAKRAYWDGVTDQKIRRLLSRPWPAQSFAKTVLSLPLLAALSPLDVPNQEFFLRFQYNIGFVREFFFKVHVKELEGATGPSTRDDSCSEPIRQRMRTR